MRFDASRLAVRSALARTWIGAASVAVMIGAGGGIVSSALWGAERVETSYDRLLVDTDAPDLLLFCEGCDDPGAKLEQVAADPQVQGAAAIISQFASVSTQSGEYLGAEPTVECATGSGELGLISSDWRGAGRPPARIFTGRLPGTGRIDEVVLSAITADRAGVVVGDTVILTAECGGGEPLELGAPIELTVVGLAVGFLDARPPGQTNLLEAVLVDEALLDHTGFSSQTLLATWLRPGATQSDLSPATVRDGVFVEVADHSDRIADGLASDASALRLFALAVSLSAAAVLSQLLWASVRSAIDANRLLTLVGATPPDLVRLGLCHGALIGIGAAAVAGLTTLVAAPLVPLGAADPIDQGTGVGLVLGAGLMAGLATLLAILLPGTASALIAARSQDRAVRPRPGRFTPGFVGTFKLPPAASLGMRFALEPAAGTRRVPIRSGLATIAVALAVVAGVVTFGAGLQRLRSTPQLVGWNWDFFVFLDDPDYEATAARIAERPDVARSGMGIIFTEGLSLVDDFSDELVFMGFDAGAGGVEPVAIDGRAPEGPDEILLAPRLAEHHELSVGEVTTLYGFTPLAQMALALEVPWQVLGEDEVSELPVEVVGIGVIPVLDGRLDTGAALTIDGYRRAFPPPSRVALMNVLDQADPERVLELLLGEGGPVELTAAERAELSAAGPVGVSAVLKGWSSEQLDRLIPTHATRPQVVFVDVADGHSLASVVRRFADDGLVDEDFLAEWFSGPRGLGEDSTGPSAEGLVKLDLGDVAWIPTSFGFLMALTALATLAYVVASGASARRRDLATARALGLRTAQVRAVVAWQSLITVAVGLAIALPLGTIGGRIAWQGYATGLQVVPESVTPWGLLGAVAAASIVAALLVSVIPGWWSARRSPVELLQSE